MVPDYGERYLHDLMVILKCTQIDTGTQACACVFMLACVHACVYMCVHVCKCVHVHVCMCVHMCACVHAHMCACVCVYMCVHACSRSHVCMCVHVCACVCTCVRVCARTLVSVYQLCPPRGLEVWRSSSAKRSEYPDLSNPLPNKRNQDSFKAWPILRLVQIIHEMSLQQLLVLERKAVLSKKKKNQRDTQKPT